MLYHLFDKVIGKIIIKADVLSGLLVISIGQSKKLNHFETFNLYYIDAANQEISLNLTYHKLSYISKPLIKKLI